MGGAGILEAQVEPQLGDSPHQVPAFTSFLDVEELPRGALSLHSGQDALRIPPSIHHSPALSRASSTPGSKERAQRSALQSNRTGVTLRDAGHTVAEWLVPGCTG